MDIEAYTEEFRAAGLRKAEAVVTPHSGHSASLSAAASAITRFCRSSD